MKFHAEHGIFVSQFSVNNDRVYKKSLKVFNFYLNLLVIAYDL